MTENEAEKLEMADARAQNVEVEEAIEQKNMLRLIGNIATSLYRIAVVQEKTFALATLDLENVIEAAVEERSQTKAQEIDEQRTKRSFLGKKT